VEVIYPASLCFNDTTEIRRLAERLVHGLRHGTDDVHAFVAAEIADYQPLHAIALAAQVCAMLDESERGALTGAAMAVATGTYRGVMMSMQERVLTESERATLNAMHHLSHYQTYRLRRGSDDVYAAVAYNIADNPTPSAIAVATGVCTLLANSELEIFAAVAAQVALGTYRSVMPGP
jgi:hypothetical protein